MERADPECKLEEVGLCVGSRSGRVIVSSSLVTGLTEWSGMGGVILTVGVDKDGSSKWPLCLVVLREG